MVSHVVKSVDPVAPLSTGASQAFSIVLSRILRKDYGTTPHILSKSSSVLREAEDARQARAARRQRRALEHRGRVGKDITRNRERERKLRMTATRGTVAMFEAVAKVKKRLESKTAEGKEKKAVVSEEGFMSMIREGVRKSRQDLKRKTGTSGDGNSAAASDSEADSDAEGDNGPGWAALKDSFMSKGETQMLQYDDKGWSGQSGPSSSESSDESSDDDSSDDDSGSESG